MAVVEHTEEYTLSLRQTTTSVDIEQSSIPSDPSDPYGFIMSIKSEDELAMLRRRKRGKGLERYHRRQNNLIEYLLKPIEEHTEDAELEEKAARLPIQIAVWASLIASFALYTLHLYAAISSSSWSLSLLAAAIDSVFGIGSLVLLIWINKKADNLDTDKWPVGGARLESIANIIYNFLMSTVNVVIIAASLRTIITHTSADDTNTLYVPSLITTGIALVVKFFLFLYCTVLRAVSSRVEILWDSHRDDLLVNGFGLLMSAGGSKFKWYFDPMGAIVISIGAIFASGRIIYHQFGLLAGKSAPRDFWQLIVNKTVTFSSDIEQITNVKVYHSGSGYIVEVNIMMDKDTPLWKSRNLSLELQNKIELLPNVSRAFVHVDYDTTALEHRKNK